MSGRVLTQKADHTPLMILAGVLVAAGLLWFSKSPERHHSGGDQGVPSFRNGGSFTDNRRAHFNPIHKVYDPSGNSDKGAEPILLLISVIVVVLIKLSHGAGRNKETL